MRWTVSISVRATRSKSPKGVLLPPGPPAAPLVTEGTEFTFVMLLIFVGCAVVFACLWGACLYSLVYVLMPKWRQRQVH